MPRLAEIVALDRYGRTVISSTSSPLLRISSAGPRRSFIGPAPILDFRHVFAMLINVIPVRDQLMSKVLFHMSGFGAQSRHSLDHVHCQMKAIKLVKDYHVEWS